MSLTREELLKVVREMITKSKLTNYRIAKESGIAAIILSRWDNGKAEPATTTLNKLYEYLNAYLNAPQLLNSHDIAKLAANNIAKKFVESDFNLIPLVPIRARAGYLSGYSDESFIEELPTIPVLTDRAFKGKYMCFEVEGDSMDNGSDKSLKDADVILCREVRKELWRSKLHIHDWYFVIVHQDGIMVKQIVDHNVNTGEITCHSLNPLYGEDFKINLSDVYELYNVIKIVDRPLRL